MPKVVARKNVDLQYNDGLSWVYGSSTANAPDLPVMHLTIDTVLSPPMSY